MTLKERAKCLEADIPAVLISLSHKSTPLCAKFFAGLTVAYALSPIDLIPDFIPILGYLDDVLILPLLVALTVKLIPKNVLDECRAAVRTSDKPKKKWYFALPIAMLWMLVLWLIVKAVLF